ncbi:hypothetical protein PVK06_034044 [Gossypium arboreum]|uniref:CCHC-type domain-containing protein n=1 Tax=Gossypium arboreum TaxID=29729 RepID=A0ABR0ND29_GOSAR|nr:hypothetical protein PVK06_034044 [Gossypium arboreum]
MMDIENGYFFVNFQNKLDCERALSECPWTIFGQYLTVQPWTMAFDPFQAYPNVVMAWIRLLGLLGYLYKHKILTEIGGMVGKVVKLDMNTYSKVRGRFARMAVYINLERHLVSQILINGRSQRVEYESLPTVCFHCGRYGHVKDNCPFRSTEIIMEKEIAPPRKSPEIHSMVEDGQEKGDENYSKGLDNARPSVVSSVANRNVGFGNSTTVQALSLLDNLGQELMAQNLLASVTSNTGIRAMVGDSSRQEAGDVISFNERHSVNLAVLGLAIEELSTNEVAVEDLGFCCSSFTWQKCGTFVKLDRAFAIDAWMASSLQSLVSHLPRIKSDHRPILLSTRPALNLAKGRPFRFLVGWTKHNNFPTFVKEKWNFAGNLTDFLNSFTSYVKEWNKDVYGFLGSRKRHLMRLLNNIQEALDHSDSSFLARQEMEVQDELENIINHEDLL